MRKLLQAVAMGVLVVLLVGSPPAYADGVVTECTQEALLDALADGGVVTFDCDGTINLTETITITNDVVLDATGRAVTISGTTFATNTSGTNVTISIISAVRIFEIKPSAPSVEFQILNLTLAKGSSTNGAAIFNNGGKLIATDCVFGGNRAVGIDGLAGADGKDHADTGANGVRGANGGHGLGGAIYNLGELSLNRCAFRTNGVSGGNGGDGGIGGNGDFRGGNGANGGDGGNGYGGAIYSLGTVSIIDCTFAGNTVNGGDGGAGGIGGDGTILGFNGSGGAGGAGSGAGLYCLGPSTIENSTFSDNSAVGGNSATAGQANNGNGLEGHRGGESLGGALCNLGTNDVINCTFFGNNVTGGDGANGGDGDVAGDGGNGGPAWGGGFYNAGVAVVNFTTFSDGSATGGAEGLAGDGRFPGSDGSKGNLRGDNVARKSGSFTLKNSIVAYGASGKNGYGTIIDGGHNISSDASLGLSTPDSLNNTDPKLGSLADNGGFTETIALLEGSPAIDAADDSDCPEFDQRGQSRPLRASCDIGAFEAEPTFTIQGRITEGTNGLSGITITAGSSTVTSDTNGNYLIGNLIADDYTVTPQPVGVGFAPPDQIVSLGPNATSINFTLNPVQITSIAPTNNGLFRLSFLGGPSRTYRIQASTNLTVWQTVFTNTAQTNGVFEFVDGGARNFKIRFYRTLAP